MSLERDEIDFSLFQLDDSNPLLIRLQEALDTCSKALEADDFRESENAVRSLIDLLDSVSETALSDPENVESKENALVVLEEIQRIVCSPSSNQMLLDALSFELPNVVAKFACVSDKCGEIAERIIECLVSICSPRDMLTILCEALDSLDKVSKTPAYFVPILNGLSKVFPCIQRRHLEQIKVTIPGVLNVLKAVSSELDDEDSDTLKLLFSRAVSVATSIQAVSPKLVGREKEELGALLGLFVLQIMALITRSYLAKEVLRCTSFMLQLSHLLPFCGLSYIGLITGRDVYTITSMIVGEDHDDLMSCFGFIKHGASLAVIWGHISDEVAKAAGENLTTVKDQLRSSQTKRWQAISMLGYVLSSIDQPWELKYHGIDLLLSIMDGDISQKFDGDHIDCSSDMPSLFTSLQAVEWVIMSAPDAVLRKTAFAALKRVLADIPSHQRFDMLKALITNSNSPSMIAILMDLVKEETLMEIQKVPPGNDTIKNIENKSNLSSPCWSSNALELVEFVLRPPKGGPPSLPEHGDAVLSALNLYRFLLITESTGKTNYTGVLSESNMQKAYKEWFLPLRTLVSGMEAENERDNNEIAVNMLCALNPVQLVLYRCIELVEEKLKQCG
ncbi:aberrant root formation protein isoform X2 [Tasmannia lanceolata]|uniref:aberrant root formation protein isoform X2 n=1 Tax=Tasmannia lanceolata TaxID=3420 RepID=UPI004063D1B8